MTQSDIVLHHVDYQADFYNRYPGELVTFDFRFSPSEAIEGTVIFEVNIPQELMAIVEQSYGPLESYGPPWLRVEPNVVVWNPRAIAEEKNYQVLFWEIDGKEFKANQHYDFQVQVKVDAIIDDFLKSWVIIKHTPPGETVQRVICKSEMITIEVESKSRLLQYLPGIYHNTEHQLMWRYLMIFESFWDLFEDRLRNLPNYFDTHMAPPDFQPWLASWIGMTWDKRIPERVRQSLRLEMIWLYQKRGTRVGLERYLQICLEVPDEDVPRKIKIVENPVGNFILGEDTHLGEVLIMGSPDEVVCKFEVTLTTDLLKGFIDEEVVKDIIVSWKPAHTSYDLFLLELKDVE